MHNFIHLGDRIASFALTQLDINSITTLAKQGFYATNTHGNITCFYCNFELTWQDGDVHTQHKQREPQCPTHTDEIQSQPLESPVVAPDSLEMLLQAATFEFEALRPLNAISPAASFSSFSSILSENDYENLSDIIMPSVNNLLSDETLPPSPPYMSLNVNLANPPANVGHTTPPNHENVTPADILHHPAYSTFRGLWVRKNSFTCWPRVLAPIIEMLSKAGFFYAQFSDVTSCFSCGGSLQGWTLDCDPWREHALWYPRCSFLKLVKGVPFIKTSRQNHHSALLSHNLDPSDELLAPSPVTESLNLCSICYNEPIQIALIPCGHTVVCASCSFTLSSCPICRNQFSSVLRTFN